MITLLLWFSLLLEFLLLINIGSEISPHIGVISLIYSFNMLFLMYYLVFRKFTLNVYIKLAVFIKVLIYPIVSFYIASTVFIDFDWIFPSDSKIIHMDNVMDGVGFLKTGIWPEYQSAYARLYLSNFVLSVAVYLFGADPSVFYSVFYIFHLLVIYFIYITTKKLTESTRYAWISIVIASIWISSTFYDFQHYKSFFLHFLMSVFIFSLASKRYYLTFSILLLLSYERFYLGFILIMSIAMAYFYINPRFKSLCTFISVLFLSFYLLYLSVDSLSNPVIIYRTLIEFSNNHVFSDAGVSINFPLSLVQIMLTPIPNEYKIEYWESFDRMLIFSFTQQIFVIYALFYLMRSKVFLNVIIFNIYIMLIVLYL